MAGTQNQAPDVPENVQAAMAEFVNELGDAAIEAAQPLVASALSQMRTAPDALGRRWIELGIFSGTQAALLLAHDRGLLRYPLAVFEAAGLPDSEEHARRLAVHLEQELAEARRHLATLVDLAGRTADGPTFTIEQARDFLERTGEGVMNVHLEQLADEAIRLREDYVSRADSMPPTARDEHRAKRTSQWAFMHPAHAALADQRLADLQRLYAEGQAPAAACTETVGAFSITARPYPRPLRHCYALHYAAAWENEALAARAVGRAWLCTTNELAGPGRYVAILDRPHGRFFLTFGDTLSDAVYRVAALADRDASEAVREGARRGAVQ